MAQIKEITYSLTGSVKVEEYQYFKPMISMTASMEDGDTYQKVFKDLKEAVHDRLTAVMIEVEKDF